MLIHGCSFHRNGVCGAGYFRLRISWKHAGRRINGTAIVFEAPDSPHLDGCIAVNDDDGAGYRYEDFADEINTFIRSPAGEQMAFHP